MAKTPTFLCLFSLANTIFVLLNISLVNSNGLTMKLIHPNSPKSPFFRTDLSHEERIKILASQSSTRASYLSNASPPTIHAEIDVQSFHDIVKIGIGTFKSEPPYREYYLEMDTGSSLVWLQCDGCTKCFNQTPKPFPKEKSLSFHPVIYQNKHATYECKYHDWDATHGILARETFHLKTKKSGLAKIENVQFGCGLYNIMKFGDYKNNKIAGIMGLGWDDISLVKQLGYKSNGKFSYCLPVVVSGKAPSAYLRFGDDINTAHKRNLKSTPLYRRRKASLYYVEMQGISINRTRLNINPQVFAYKNNNTSGCIIDTGTPYSRIIAPAFDILKLELEKYFSRLKGMKRTKSDLGLDVCYERSKADGFKNLPDITFHLQGSHGDFVMKAEAAFEVVSRFRLINAREYICLAMVRDDEKSIIGSHQQTNHRIIHDTKNKLLVFYPEDCSKNP